MVSYRRKIMLKVHGHGIVTKDVEIKFIGQNDVALAKTSIAFKRSFKKDDKWVDETTFVNCQAWGNLAKRLDSDVNKGDLIAVEGYLEQNNWNDQKTGQKRSNYTIRLDRFVLGIKTNKGKSNGNDSNTVPQNEPVPSNTPQENGNPDVPF
jgi:single-strand DNA-binding protein